MRLVMSSSIVEGGIVEPESEPGAAGVYEVHGPSGNHTLAEMLAHTHRIFTGTHLAALTLAYRSLRSNRYSKRNGYKKSQKDWKRVLRTCNPQNRAKRAKKREVKMVARILWKDSRIVCWK
jgi:hypothetical protein